LLHRKRGGGQIDDVASINQTGAGIRLPNFCNLGVMLRSLVFANLFVLAAGVARASTPTALGYELLVMAAFCEPVLIASLAVLCAARRLLHSIGYAAALAAIAAFEVALAWVAATIGAELLPDRRSIPFAHVAFLTLFVTASLLAYFDLRARALAPAVAEARIQALQARIRPHFLYNSINAVLSLIRTEPRRAERALEDMADLFRVLMADNRTLAPIADEVELARQYLALESLRLGERLRVTWRTETMPRDALMPPLVLQPLVENAVYHGIEPSESGGEIVIDVALVGGQLVMSLTNPFPGAARHSSGNRMALVNIRERLQLHFDAEATMKSEVRDGRYHVTIRVPYITAPA
jgi:two-component system, LytTR family, sensor histidine kinase AlgZ